MTARLFSLSEDAILKELYSTKTNKELAEILNNQYSIKQIKYRGKALHLLKTKETKRLAQDTRASVWLEWEKELLRKHYCKDGIEFLHNLLPNRGYTCISNKANKMGFFVPKENKNYARGPKHHSEESRLKMSKSKIGVPFTEEHRNNLIKSARRGSNHPMWKGGLSKIPYGDEFTIELKHKIKQRDNYQCKRCFKKPSWTYLIVHHIDYNKKNSSEKNLITLCKSCHTQHHLNSNVEQQEKEQASFNDYISGKYKVV